mgnify:CR=1 FL=1
MEIKLEYTLGYNATLRIKRTPDRDYFYLKIDKGEGSGQLGKDAVISLLNIHDDNENVKSIMGKDGIEMSWKLNKEVMIKFLEADFFNCLEVIPVKRPRKRKSK